MLEKLRRLCSKCLLHSVYCMVIVPKVGRPALKQYSWCLTRALSKQHLSFVFKSFYTICITDYLLNLIITFQLLGYFDTKVHLHQNIIKYLTTHTYLKKTFLFLETKWKALYSVYNVLAHSICPVKSAWSLHPVPGLHCHLAWCLQQTCKYYTRSLINHW